MRTARTIPERERQARLRVPLGIVVALEFVVLGLGAALVVLVLVPSVFEIDSSCVGSLGAQRTSGDTYVAGFAVLGTAGWIGVGLGTLYAGIFDRGNVLVLLPVTWAALLVIASVVTGALVGPAICPA